MILVSPEPGVAVSVTESLAWLLVHSVSMSMFSSPPDLFFSSSGSMALPSPASASAVLVSSTPLVLAAPPPAESMLGSDSS